MEDCPAGAIKQHAFFAKMDFDRLEKRQIRPPFEPKIVSFSGTIWTRELREFLMGLPILAVRREEAVPK